MTNKLPYQYLVVEGNIGAGKTTLCQMLAKQFDSRLILEQFTENPFLPHFYKDHDRYAFPVELFFMTERHRQLKESLNQIELFRNLTIADYFFVKTLLFAKNNLGEEEIRLFQQLFNILNTSFPKPDLLVFLHRSVDDLLVNIKKRGREYEKDISAEYLMGIQNIYFDYFRLESSFPILIIDVEQIDFLNSESHYNMIVDALAKKYTPGMHHLSFVTG